MIENKGTMWLIAGAIVGGAMIVLIVLSLVLSSTKMYPSEDKHLTMFHSDQCERPHSRSSVAEPENSWSNLAYLLAGVLVLLRARSLMGILFGVNLCLLAITSGLYHATLTHTTQVLDVVWVYAALFALIVYGSYVISRQNDFGVPTWAWIAISAVLTVLAICIRAWWVWDSTIVFVVLVAVLAVLVLSSILASMSLSTQFGGTCASCHLTLELMIIGVIAIVGFTCRLGDGYDNSEGVRKFLCNPDGAIQAHALWHILSAAALLLTYDLFAQLLRGMQGGPTDRPTVFPDYGAA